MSRDSFDLYVPRTAQLVSAPGAEQRLPAGVPFQDFFEHPMIVLLGDPGLGKTELFLRMAEAEGGQYETVRNFLDLRLDQYRSEVLYLDGLDEVRSGSTDGGNVVGQLLGRLDELRTPKVRLSCRAADWFGDSDTSRLKRISQSGEVTALTLDPLTEADIQALSDEQLGDAARFLERAKEHGLDELLHNPLTLLLLIRVVTEGRWPTNRTEVYAQGLDLLAREQSEVHEGTATGAVATNDVLKAAGYLSAVYLLAGLGGISLTRSAESTSFPYLYDLSDVSRPLLEATVRRRLFTTAQERASPRHRTVAEFLAARFLAETIRGGLPWRRCLALLQGSDGGIPSDRRGLFAWLVTLAPEYAGTLIPIDPMAVVLYGDPASLPTATRAKILEELVALSERDPYFRADEWEGRPFGTLSTPELTPRLLEIIEDRNSTSHLVFAALDVLTHGVAALSVADQLLPVVRDEDRTIDVRFRGLQALLHNSPRESGPLRALLEDIANGSLNDPHHYLRGELLLALFPHAVSPAELPWFLVVDSLQDGRGWNYRKFLYNEAVGRLDDDGLAELLDALSESSIRSDLTHRSGFRFRDFIGQAVVEGLRRWGAAVSPDRLLRWLRIPASRHGGNTLEPRYRQQVKDWFDEHHEVLSRLYIYFVSELPTSELRSTEYRFWGSLVLTERPPGLAREMLELAADEVEDERAAFYFHQAWRTAWIHPAASDVGIEELHRFVKVRPRFKDALQQLIVCDLPERDWNFSRAEEEREQQELISTNLAELKNRIEATRSGSDWGALMHLSDVQEGLTLLVDQKLPKESRIPQLYGAEIASAAAAGFEAAITAQGQPTASKIGEAEARKRHFDCAPPILCGLESLWSRSPETLLELPNDALERAVAYRLHFEDETDDEWLDGLAGARSELVAGAIEAYWRPLLRARKETLGGLYRVTGRHALVQVAARVAKSLLLDFPRANAEIVRKLIVAALRAPGHEWLMDLAEDQMENYRALRTPQYLSWLTAGYTLAPDLYRERLVRHAAESLEKAYDIASFMSVVLGGDAGPTMGLVKPLFQLSQAYDLIQGLGAVCSPEDLEEKGPSMSKSWSLSRNVAGLIDRLGSDPSHEAAEYLQLLQGDRRLAPWRPRIAHAVQAQARARRDAEAEAPTLVQVRAMLANGAPANPRDLLALLVGHLDSVSHELRDGPTDAWRQFWNTESDGRAKNPKDENTCRDILLGILNPRLAPLSVHIESESRHAENTRADIRAVTFHDSKPVHLPVEMKRHWNRHLWRAIENQLIPRYTRDPSSGGFGLYVVFWFGAGEGKVPRPPHGTDWPGAASELQRTLEARIPEEDRARIAVACVDLSKP